MSFIPPIAFRFRHNTPPCELRVRLYTHTNQAMPLAQHDMQNPKLCVFPGAVGEVPVGSRKGAGSCVYAGAGDAAAAAPVLV